MHCNPPRLDIPPHCFEIRAAMKLVTCFLLLFCLFSPLPQALAQGQEGLVGDQIVAVVDRQIITARDLDYWVLERRIESPDLWSVPEDMIRKRLVTEAVDELLLGFWAENEIIELPQEAVEIRYQAAMKQYERLTGGPQQLRDMVRESGLQMNDFRRWVKERAGRLFLIRQAMTLTAGVGDWGPVDEDPNRAVRLRLAHVLIKPKGMGEEAEQAAEERALRVRRDIAAGVGFAEAARLYSDDEATALKAGDLGWFEEDALNPELAAAAKGLQPGQTSQPVRTGAGWHIIRLVDYDTPERINFLRRMKAARRFRLGMLRKEHQIRTAEGYQLEELPPIEAEPPTGVWDAVEADAEQSEAAENDGS